MSEPAKGPGDENFPVASILIAPRHRPVVLAFYAVARMADDVADDPAAAAADKLARLDAIDASLTGEDDAVAEAITLRRALAERAIPDTHIRELLQAFRRDVTQTRYADWVDLMDYCRYSASPVGRFMLDVHGQDHATWPASDALCSALQVINHLQDCGEDYREINRVYVPNDALAAAGLTVEALGAAQSSPALRGVIVGLAERTAGLLATSSALAPAVTDRRLALEIGVIQSLAEALVGQLLRRDPLAERVKLSRLATAGALLRGVAAGLTRGRRSGSERVRRNPHRPAALR